MQQSTSNFGKQPKEGIKRVEMKWIPMTFHIAKEPDEIEMSGEDAKIYENLPQEGERVLLSIAGMVVVDECCFDLSTNGYYFDTYELDEVDAWMPLPAPYETEETRK